MSEPGLAPRERRPSIWKHFVRQPNIMAGSVLLVAVGLTVVISTLAGLSNPLAHDVSARFLPPSSLHVFGTDQYGRDVFSRIIWGTRLSLSFGVATLVLGSLIGVAIGATAGYLGGTIDTILSRVVDTIMAFPLILVAIVLLSALGINTVTLVLTIGFCLSPRFARVMRGQVLQTKTQEYIEAARAVGASELRIVLRHILPNSAGPLIVLVTLMLPFAILVESSLSFLGLGVEPDTPTWGRIIADGRAFIQEAPWITIAPGAAITLCTIGFNLLGDGLRDILDPKLRT